MPTDDPLVYILVLHWRGIEHTRNCLTSVRQLRYKKYAILLVDNGSDALDGDALKSEFPEVDLLRLPENKGFAGGCNAGISYGIDRGADFIWVLNNDTILRPDSLSLLVAAAQHDDKAAALSAAVLDSVLPVGSGVQASEKIIPGKGVLDFVRGKSLLKPHSGNQPVECEWLAASNLLVRASAVRGKKAFDERYFLYFEDTELCHRLTLEGWKCLFVPAAKIAHVGGASTSDKLQHWRSYYHTRNRLLFFSTYTRFPNNIFCLASIHAHLLRHRMTLPRKGEGGVRQLEAELLGLKDFESKRFGRCTELDQY